ncbi:MAG TPA: zf-HC2 domain-containing protein [Vicinamibacterales bacterium]|jgi:anti-sigma factor RsiW|nr:zf-HC2 domain-containing protein [Vicinamibacterales bacterium]
MRNADCAALLERVSAYLDQELDEATCRAIDEHCQGCTDCAGVIAGLRATIGLCRATGERPLPPAVRARARAQIERLLASFPDKT